MSFNSLSSGSIPTNSEASTETVVSSLSDAEYNLLKTSGFFSIMGSCDPASSSRRSSASASQLKRKRSARSQEDAFEHKAKKPAALHYGGGGRPRDETSWMQHYESLIAWAKINGSTNVPYTCEDRILSQWVKNQRALFRKGTLAPERIEKLQTINFCWSARDKHKTFPRSGLSSTSSSASTLPPLELLTLSTEETSCYEPVPLPLLTPSLGGFFTDNGSQTSIFDDRKWFVSELECVLAGQASDLLDAIVA